MVYRFHGAAIVCATAMLLVSGCTPQARDDVDHAGSDLKAAAVNSADGTKAVIDSADEKAKEESAIAVKSAKKKLDVADKVVAKDANSAVQGAERAAAKATMDTKKTEALVTLTPKVKGAILLDDRVRIPDLDVDTKPDVKEVVVNGTASSAEMKAEALADAKRELIKANPTYTVVDRVKVGSPHTN